MAFKALLQCVFENHIAFPDRFFKRQFYMAWDKYAAIRHVRDRAYSQSHHKCELFVKEAIIAGGVNIYPTPSAKDMGKALIKEGFY